MSKSSIPTWFFVLVVVRKADRFLLIRECKHGQLWYFPAGRVEPGEGIVEAAKRETLEEAGIGIQVNGVIRIEHTPVAYGTRVRLILSAEPIDDSPPKSEPDDESLEARWFTLEDVSNLPLRDPSVLNVFAYIENGGIIAPLDILAKEGDPF
ncbi:MAG: NUDIX domain-containing protein [Cellvibrionaceae bacterium]